MKKTIEVACSSCDATGLYVGFAEQNGAAVVCCNCKGTGKCTIVYDTFEGRQHREGVRRVYRVNPGIGIGEGTTHTGETVCLEDFGGMPYEEWETGTSFPPGSEDRKHVCPAWWYQSADLDKKPSWPECILLGSFSKCSRYCTKDHCWEKWDKEFGHE